MTDSIDIIQPDDFHHHLRDDTVLGDVVLHASRTFGRILVMPNLKPPIRTVDDAIRYKERISSHIDPMKVDYFSVLMTIYLTDVTTPEDVSRARESGIIQAFKLYPAGATTNSEFGVTSLDKLHAVFERMIQENMPLCVHGEVTDPRVDIFDREKVFIERVLQDLVSKYPKLKIIMEHITTKEAVDFITNQPESSHLVATITAHHLLYDRNDIFKNGICPHMYCLPILKRSIHREALLQAVSSGNKRFFAGTDSAPHAISSKESACGCAGIFTGHAAVELYAEVFDSLNALEKLEGFVSRYGAEFYNLPINQRKIRLKRESWMVPDSYRFGETVVVPLRRNEIIQWTCENIHA